MHKGYFPLPKEENIYKEVKPTKKQRWREITLEDKINMVYDVIIGKEKVVDVVKRFSRTQGYISNIVSRMKKNNELFRELIDKRDQRIMKQSIV